MSCCIHFSTFSNTLVIQYTSLAKIHDPRKTLGTVPAKAEHKRRGTAPDLCACTTCLLSPQASFCRSTWVCVKARILIGCITSIAQIDSSTITTVTQGGSKGSCVGLYPQINGGSRVLGPSPKRKGICNSLKHTMFHGI